MPPAGFKWSRFIIVANWWSNVDKNGPFCKSLGSHCWLWTGTVEQGYGRCTRSLNGEIKAHRASFVEHHGPILPGNVVDHLCDIGECVNPEHLEQVTQAENNRRIGERGRTKNGKKTHCPRGHAYDRTYKGKRFCSDCVGNRGVPITTEVEWEYFP